MKLSYSTFTFLLPVFSVMLQDRKLYVKTVMCDDRDPEKWMEIGSNE